MGHLVLWRAGGAWWVLLQTEHLRARVQGGCLAMGTVNPKPWPLTLRRTQSLQGRTPTQGAVRQQFRQCARRGSDGSPCGHFTGDVDLALLLNNILAEGRISTHTIRDEKSRGFSCRGVSEAPIPDAPGLVIALTLPECPLRCWLRQTAGLGGAVIISTFQVRKESAKGLHERV